MLGLVVFGSRTWMCTIAAPALAASSAEVAICSGVTATGGLRPGVSAEPVTAHEMMTLRCMTSPKCSANWRAFPAAPMPAFYSRAEDQCRVGGQNGNDHERGRAFIRRRLSHRGRCGGGSVRLPDPLPLTLLI